MSTSAILSASDQQTVATLAAILRQHVGHDNARAADAAYELFTVVQDRAANVWPAELPDACPSCKKEQMRRGPNYTWSCGSCGAHGDLRVDA